MRALKKKSVTPGEKRHGMTTHHGARQYTDTRLPAACPLSDTPASNARLKAVPTQHQFFIPKTKVQVKTMLRNENRKGSRRVEMQRLPCGELRKLAHHLCYVEHPAIHVISWRSRRRCAGAGPIRLGRWWAGCKSSSENVAGSKSRLPSDVSGELLEG